MDAVGLPLGQFAALIGTSEPNVVRWRTGKVRPAYDFMLQIHAALSGVLEPEHRGLLDELAAAAGYEMPSLPAFLASLPKLIRDHLDDPRVTEAWFKSGLPAPQALGMISAYLEGREAQAKAG